MLRQYLTNVYNNNFPRTISNERVDLDDLLTPRSGGNVRVSGEGPIGDSLSTIPVQQLGGEILQGIEYMDISKEIRTGVTRHNQGLNAESLNTTATGFKGIMDASQQRMELISRIFADTGIKNIFRKIIKNASQYQNNAQQVRILGKTMDINPTDWRYNLSCYVDVGMGSGDRNEKIINLNNILAQQKELKAVGSPLSDDKKMYNSLSKLVTETGLKEASLYFNDPEVPDEILQAENELLKSQLFNMQQQLQQLSQNPLAEAEQVKAQKELLLAQQRIENQNQQFILKLQSDNEQFMLKLQEDQRQAIDNQATKLTELELEHDQNVPGALV